MILPYFPYNPKAKLRLEVLFKKCHPRINLATLFFTKSYLLNTISHFQAMKTEKEGTLRNLNFKILSIQAVAAARDRWKNKYCFFTRFMTFYR
jgi:hypothetical protein